ncbi:cytochrome c-type biogenesis protein CcsB [Desulfurobacterium thermolithotrophum DSM 11699]|uniref:Cytochrome c-type biogenesis protein CcsB n=1 Tax=Desulfurobacterium thermolithotrophum (strain DSM 11699 / BSA) TaxID=868864 RepID=F0S126_DESTD|nr:c-type cytochrome biogenesis protein CcsB [Desulfurobacterium thermolithotrophum]ADY73904.1 cytochrome c-type biogenesis protein CcsB [Desulfurobacterium thermolithotrophum DSM 11699]
MVNSVTLFNTGMVAFSLAFLFYTIHTFSKSSWSGKLGTYLAWLGVLVQGAAFIVRGIEKAKVNMVSDWTAFYKYAPFTNMYESLMLFGWMAVLLYLLFEWKYKNKAFGMFIIPLALMGELSTQILGFDEEAQPLVPALQSNWLLFHVVTTFVGYAAAAVSAGIAYAYFARRNDTTGKDWTVIFVTTWFIFFFVIYSAFRENVFFFLFVSAAVAAAFCAFLYLLNRYGISKIFPSPETMEQIMYQSVAVGFVFLTIGIILGAVWAKYAWGGYWSWDPKETWSLITWLVYAAYLHARYIKGLSGKPLAYFTIIGFLSVIFTYYGVNLIIPGLHSYAQ